MIQWLLGFHPAKHSNWLFFGNEIELLLVGLWTERHYMICGIVACGLCYLWYEWYGTCAKLWLFEQCVLILMTRS